MQKGWRGREGDGREGRYVTRPMIYVANYTIFKICAYGVNKYKNMMMRKNLFSVRVKHLGG